MPPEVRRYQFGYLSGGSRRVPSGRPGRIAHRLIPHDRPDKQEPADQCGAGDADDRPIDEPADRWSNHKREESQADQIVGR